MKRTFAMLLTFALFLTLPAMALAAEPPVLPLCEPGSVTFRVMVADNWYTPKSYSQNLEMYQLLEQQTGVKVIWDVTVPDEYNTVMTTRMAAAIDLPDIVNAGSLDVAKLAKDGVVLPLTKLIEENAYYTTRMYEMDPFYKKGNTAYDGEIYQFQQLGEGILSGYKDMEIFQVTPPGANVNLPVAGIRQDWLTKLGLSMPTSRDEWEAVLREFKTKDPNGNGQADEIPLSPTWSWWDLMAFATPEGIYIGGNGNQFQDDGDGVVKYAFLNPELKKTFEWLHKLYDEGLLNVEFASTTFDTTQERIVRNIIGSVPDEWMSNFPSWTNNLRAGGVPDAQWAPVLPLAGPDGVVKTTNRWAYLGGVAITKDCKNPELAVKWLDYQLLSPEGIKMQMFGVEGLTYTMVDGSPKFTDFVLKNPDGLGPFEAIRAVGGWGQLAYIQTKDAYIELFKDTPGMVEFGASIKDVRQPFGAIRTPDEIDRYTAIATDLNTYRDEMAVKFISGEESLDNYDAFISTLIDMGAEEMVAIYQSAHDRYLGKK